jgi:glycosyltransferase involved in cell wall biosynthesis
MKVIIDISVDDLTQKESILFYRELYKRLSNIESQYKWVFIASSKDIVKANFNGLTVIDNEYLTAKGFFKRLRQKRKFHNEIKKQKADLLLSSKFISKATKNIFLLTNARLLKSLNQNKLKNYKAVIVASESLKNFFIRQFEFDTEKIFTIPIKPGAEFVKLNEELKQQVKETVTQGFEYFLLTAQDVSAEQFTVVLKSFSVFKKRLQSGMKLLVAAMQEQLPHCLALLNNYKYKDDVLFLNETNINSRLTITAAAYAVIHLALDDGWVLPQEVLQCEVPVVMMQPSTFTQQPGLYVYAEEGSVDDIAHKLMLLYKDETHRNKVIENSKKQLSQFSQEETVKALMNCLMNV